MNHWPFIFAAYGLTLVGVVGLVLVSFFAMRKAEREADALRREP
jgi:heme exporter protein D